MARQRAALSGTVATTAELHGDGTVEVGITNGTTERRCIVLMSTPAKQAQNHALPALFGSQEWHVNE